MKFEWDPDKANANLKSHKVDFAEATTVFNDPLSITYPDPDHSYAEDRFIIRVCFISVEEVSEKRGSQLI